MAIIHDLKLPLEADESQIKVAACQKAGISPKNARTFRILRRSLDARKKNDIKYVYSVEISKDVLPHVRLEIPQIESKYRPLVVGFGPAGMLAAYVLAKSGSHPIVFERGDEVNKRKAKVDLFRSSGILDVESNAQFGAGGAGAFSDGKLNTGIGEREKQSFILQLFVDCGADKDILIDAKPHIGTDKLLPLVNALANKITELGGEILYNTTVTSITADGDLARVETTNGEYVTDSLVLAIGHSARDTYNMLYRQGFDMESKPFAMGFRIEHLQRDINYAAYGDAYENSLLPPAEYKAVSHTPYGGVYSFCMCPGGYVTATSSEYEGIVTNGMSYSARDGINANAALLTQIEVGKGLFDGMEAQRELERRAFVLGGGKYGAPCQKLGDFVDGKQSVAFGRIKPTYTPEPRFARLDKLFTEKAYKAFCHSFGDIAKRIKGFDAKDSLLTAVESRSSAPVRILRGDGLRSTNRTSVYPCGEGCGYAGGIMSAAVDGLKVALAIIKKYNTEK